MSYIGQPIAANTLVIGTLTFSVSFLQSMSTMVTTELHWVCVGYDTKQQRNDALGYVTDTAAQAEALCRKLHPNFDIYYTKRVDD